MHRPKRGTPPPQTIDDAVRIVLEEMTEKEKTDLRDCSDRDFLVRYHFGLGMYLRGRFKLWDGEQPIVKNAGRFVHEDSLSMEIIVEARKRLQAKP